MHSHFLLRKKIIKEEFSPLRVKKKYFSLTEAEALNFDQTPYGSTALSLSLLSCHRVLDPKATPRRQKKNKREKQRHKPRKKIQRNARGCCNGNLIGPPFPDSYGTHLVYVAPSSLPL